MRRDCLRKLPFPWSGCGALPSGPAEPPIRRPTWPRSGPRRCSSVWWETIAPPCNSRVPCWNVALRLSPEAPVPVVRMRSSTVRPGGAANTAANLAALGATPLLVGVVGNDRAAEELQEALLQCGVAVDSLISENARPTTTKTRIIASHQQIVRVDEEDTAPLPRETEERALQAIAEGLERSSAVVVSDYAKGFLTPSLLKFVTAAAGRAGKRVFMDPKGADYTRYLGCFLMKPNRLELSSLTGLPARNHQETLAAGNRLSALMPGATILVTEGADGMTLFAS